MAGPWEEYQKEPPKGPWDSYAKPEAKPARKRDDSFSRGVALGAMKPIDTLASAAANLPGVRQIDEFGQSIGLPSASQASAANQAARAENTSVGGQIVGNIIGTLPTAALPGGAFVQGAAGGALLSDAQDAGGVLMDAAFGAGGAKAASAALTGIRGAVAPRVSDYVRRLTNAGVELTPGQVLGGAAKRLENVATSIPFVGDAIRGAQRRGMGTFNRATVNRALAPIGKALPDTVKEGNEAVRFAGNALSQEYDNVLANLNGNVDNTFVTRLGAIRSRANLPEEELAQFNDIVKREIGALFPRPGGGGNQARASGTAFTGRQLNQVRDRLDKVGSALRANTQNPYSRALGEAIGDVREQVMSLARRQNPDAADRLRALDKGWSELIRVERAATNATEGVFTPGQYSTAVRQSDRSVRKRAVARGEALAQDFADAARSTLPSNVPDSGTAGRLVTMALGGGAVANPGAVLPAVGAGAATMAAYTPAATRAFQAAATRQVGPAGNFVARVIDAGRVPISVSAPALLRRREQ